MRTLNRGITLIELMIVIVIVGILAAIAYPSYARYVEQARRADGKAALLDAAQRLERCYTQNNTYVDCDGFLPSASPDGFYTVDVSAIDATSFTLTAVPEGPQADSPCRTYTLASDGTRGVTGGASLSADRCW
jgi:type IV pilus assembly protein PilE